MIPRRKSCFEGDLPAAILCLFLLIPQLAGAVSDVEMTGFKVLQETDNGRWEIQGGKAFYDGQGDVILEKVSAKMISDGRESVNVVSDKGRYEPERLILHLEGHVVVTSGLGSRFKTPKLRWDGRSALMLADNGVQLERGPLKVLGDTVRYTVKSGTVIVAGGVRTTWDERSDRP
ncbi:MAG: LPS export ABC transporter periplasmic protein LptC [bacterium]|nr:LPS export ABC transporter periplasmic protein LptC [bacterium]MDT8365267.1 LPS export ABC transporter periplasmic protein LptC [bacterium]